MVPHDQNFYRVDGVLLRVGAAGLVFVLLAGGLGLLYANAISADETLPPGYAGFLVAEYAFAYTALLMCPLVTLRVGWTMRRRERRIGAIWKLLQRNAQVSAAEGSFPERFTSRRHSSVPARLITSG